MTATTRIVQRPPNRRVDSFEDGRLGGTYLSLDGQLMSCTPDGCNPVRKGDPEYINITDSPIGFDVIFSAREFTGDGIEGYDVTRSHRDIAELPSDCFHATPRDPSPPNYPVELCFATEDSALLFLRVDVVNGDYFWIEANQVNYDVTDRDFDPNVIREQLAEAAAP